ncbi:uncharacterized protein LY89DRAFT_426736 [Mollisia scopiformis]|uniref:Uncharacterized protein n=1 Tax=Mollisia scopiformis TaxID=149040 RepID=A0A194XMV1_MOLSC|nr:uncharacterized protein LY89DRAFT_426736 [Mollisia scopiformis]KUJ21102.1 hypothetical protein LY89DRAFT_426736 [Mollisia scopiformis]
MSHPNHHKGKTRRIPCLKIDRLLLGFIVSRSAFCVGLSVFGYFVCSFANCVLNLSVSKYINNNLT